MTTATKTKTAPTPAVNMPVSPVVQPQGKSTKGAHIQAWRACDKFAHDAKLELTSGAANPWKKDVPGDIFYRGVLAKAPKTVGEAVALAGKLTPAIRESEVQGHLRWLYTMSGSYVRIGGKSYQEDPHVRAPKAPKAKAQA
jgi:hypothetical protein